MMKRTLLGVIAVLFMACAPTTPVELNPSGVWLFQGKGNMNYKKTYSWGENATYNQATVIDLEDHKPYVDTEWGRFFVLSQHRKGNRYTFSGIWAEGETGNISIVFSDQNTMWFEKTVPKGRADIGKENFYKRVSPDAPIIPINQGDGP